MRSIHDLPIKQKVTLLLLFACTVTVLVGATSTTIYEYIHFRGRIVRDAKSQAELVAANTAAAVAFRDQEEATKILTGFRGLPEIVYALLYDADGQFFAQYNPRHLTALPAPETAGYRCDSQGVLLFHPVKLKNDVVGTLVLRTDCREETLRMMMYLVFAAVGILVSFGLAVVIARRLQQLVTRPILELARTAEAVAVRKDYSLRVTKLSHDEIGVLADSFNGMLEQIQSRDAALRASEQRFRQLAENIQEVFWLSAPDKSEIIYVSPAYERIWGRSREKLYASATDWLEAIHPEDRERIKHAAKTKQLAGSYDEEYRVVQPDGSIRWIRDRAFPVLDETGIAYRIAGIAEDVTERKRLQQQLLSISDREQRRIGQDLHDGLCQHLAGTGFLASGLERELVSENHHASARAARIRDLIQQAVGQARGIARGLYPVHLDAEGLRVALGDLVRRVEEQTQIPCTFHCSPTALVHDNAVALHLYRIAQEAVSNAIRHANPRRIDVRFEADEEGGRLVVADDGNGLPQNRSKGDGMGLSIMSDRVQMIGGTLDICSDRQTGTIITCTFKQPKRSSSQISTKDRHDENNQPK